MRFAPRSIAFKTNGYIGVGAKNFDPYPPDDQRLSSGFESGCTQTNRYIGG